MKAAWICLAIVFSGILIIHCSDDSIVTSKSDLSGTYQGTYTVVCKDYYQPNWPGIQIPVACTLTDSSWTLVVDTSREVPSAVCMCLAQGWYRVIDNRISFRQLSLLSPVSGCQASMPCDGHDGLFSFARSQDSDTLTLTQYGETDGATRQVILVRYRVGP